MQGSNHSSHVRFSPKKESEEEEEDRNRIKNEIVKIIIDTLELIPAIAETLAQPSNTNNSKTNTSSTSLSSDDEEYFSIESQASSEIVGNDSSKNFIEDIVKEVLAGIHSKCKSSTCARNTKNENILRSYIEELLSECFELDLYDQSKGTIISKDKTGRHNGKCTALDKNVNDSSNELISIIMDSCKQKKHQCIQTCEECGINKKDIKKILDIAMKIINRIVDYLNDKNFRVLFGPSLDEAAIATIAYLPYAPVAYRRMRYTLQALVSTVDESYQSIPDLALRLVESSNLPKEDIVDILLIAHKAIQTDCDC